MTGAVVFAAALSGCGGQVASEADVGATHAQASAESAAESQPASGSAAAAGETAPPPSIDPDLARIDLSAGHNAFSADRLEAPAGELFVIVFTVDAPAGVVHDVAIRDDNGETVFDGEDINGGETIVYAVPTLEPGTYTFVCTPHPSMTGTLTVS